VAFGVVTEASSGFPGYNSVIGTDNATIGGEDMKVLPLHSTKFKKANFEGLSRRAIPMDIADLPIIGSLLRWCARYDICPSQRGLS
jgi:hypothetical protein